VKSPIKNRKHVNNSGAVIRGLIPRGAVVNSYAFYDGKIEFGLAENGLFVKAHTASLPVYHFWRCMEYNSKKVYDIVTSDDFKFEDEQMFSVLQDIWHENSSPFIKAALFFLLNSHSETGMISSGTISKEYFNPISISYLRRFRMPENFHISYSGQTIESIQRATPSEEYSFIAGGKFNYGLFEHGKNRGIEETLVNHRKLAELTKTSHNRIIATYDYDPRVLRAYNNCRLTLVNQYGMVTTNENMAKEVVVANF